MWNKSGLEMNIYIYLSMIFLWPISSCDCHPDQMTGGLQLSGVVLITVVDWVTLFWPNDPDGALLVGVWLFLPSSRL